MQCLAAGGAASRGACPTWVQCARRRPAVMAAQEGGGESTGRAARLGASGTRDAWGGAGKAGRAVCGCDVRGVAACTARLGAASPCACAAQGGCLARRGVRPREEARAREGSRERPGRARGAEAGRERPSNARGRAGAGQRRGRREKEKRIGKEKEKWGKREKGKRERDMLGGDHGVDRGCTRTRVGQACRGGRRYAMRGIGKREERDSD